MGAIWPLDLFITVEIQFWLSNQHGRDPGRQITLERGPIFRKQSQKNRPYISINRRLIGVIGNFSLKSPIYRVSTIYRRFFGNFLRKNGPPIYLNEMSCRLPQIHDISRHFPPCLILIVMHTFRTHPLKPAIKGRVPECL